MGMLFLFTGNPGSGKDSVISELVKNWDINADLYIPKRIITRPPHISEDYISVSYEEFLTRLSGKELSFYWESYDILYALPADIYDYLQKQTIIIANVSRDIVSHIKNKIKNTRCIFINVDPEEGLKRVENRGRESVLSDQFLKRRQKLFEKRHFEDADIEIDNTKDISICVSKVKNYILAESDEYFKKTINS